MSLEAPFDIVHIDSHGDLGMGDASYEYIMTKHLVEQRGMMCGYSTTKLHFSESLSIMMAKLFGSQSSGARKVDLLKRSLQC